MKEKTRLILISANLVDHHLREACEKFLGKIVPTDDDEGFSCDGFHTNFDSIKTVAGYPQQPVKE